MLSRRKFLAALGVVPFAPAVLKGITFEEKVAKPALGITSKTSIPTGTILPFAGEEIPHGWLLCDGQAINRDDFPKLYEVIGSNFGSDFYRDRFKVPDMRVRMHNHQAVHPPLEYAPTPVYLIKA